MTNDRTDLAEATASDDAGDRGDYIDLTEAETIRLPDAAAEDGGHVARKPDEIVAEIEATRAELADTIDAIAGRINPRRAAKRSANAVKAQASAVRGKAEDAVDALTPSTGPMTEEAPGPVLAAQSAPQSLAARLADPKVLVIAGVIGAIVTFLFLRHRD
jgi:hypothetical protein